MKRWMKSGLFTLALGLGLAFPALAGELDVTINDVNMPVTAAQVTVSVSGSETVAFKSNADGHALRDNDNGTWTLYVASAQPLNSGGKLSLGSLSVADGAEVMVLSDSLRLLAPGMQEIPANKVGDVIIGTGDGSGGGAPIVDRTPQVSVDGDGGTVVGHKDGSVTITPDSGYRIAKILVNGEEVAISTTLTGLSAKDEVVVRFEKIATGDLPFADVAADAWYYDAVRYAYEHGLMAGTAADAFAPNTTTTRGMIVTILHRMEGEPSAVSAGFSDVAQGAYYENAVNWAAANGIVNGYGGGLFGPNDVITREQFAAILQNYADYKGVDTSARADLSVYDDAAAVSGWAAEALSWANAEGLIGGMSASELAPKGSATRAQAAAILMRYCEQIAQ